MSVQSIHRVYTDLASAWPESDWLRTVSHLAEQRLATHEHGDLPRWRDAIAALPAVAQCMQADRAEPGLGADAEEPRALRETLMQLHPWRKGPLRLGGVAIDTEWRSDWKWDRLSGVLDLRGARVLDIGCGNGYFGWRMLGAGAKLVVGVDPTLVFVMQWLACRHFAGAEPNFVLPLGIEDLPPPPAGFDAVFSMGVLYHRRDPQQHLQQIRQLLRPDGTLVLETLVLPPTDECSELVPENRYARMRNVWCIPGIDTLMQWVEDAGFTQARVVDVTATTTGEQRSTDWMRFESLSEALDPENERLTLEGYPAPTRAIVVAGS